MSSEEKLVGDSLGQPKKCRRKFDTPPHPWQEDRILAENELLKKYGLTNKKEIWKAESKLRKYRRQARLLLAKTTEDIQAEKEKEQLIDNLIKYGILSSGADINEVLALNVDDVLQRRLQTIAYMKGLSNSLKQSRQFIVHGHIAVNDRRVTVPGFLVKKCDEDNITYDNYSPLVDELHPMRPKIETLQKTQNAPKETTNQGGDK